VAGRLVEAIAALAPDPDERAQARAALLRLLPGGGSLTLGIPDAIAALAPDPGERAEVRAALLERLSGADSDLASTLWQAIAALDPNVDTLRRAMGVSVGIDVMRSIARATRCNVSQQEWAELLPELGKNSALWLVEALGH
jgi:hypothetical protein